MRPDRENIAAAFGRALKQERTRIGLSQEELAFRANVDRTFVSRAERGERQPALATVFLLARALKISPGALVTAAETSMSQKEKRSTRRASEST